MNLKHEKDSRKKLILAQLIIFSKWRSRLFIKHQRYDILVVFKTSLQELNVKRKNKALTAIISCSFYSTLCCMAVVVSNFFRLGKTVWHIRNPTRLHCLGQTIFVLTQDGTGVMDPHTFLITIVLIVPLWFLYKTNFD